MRRGIGVAIVSREYPPFFGGGIGTYAANIAPALAEAGACVHVITQAHDGSNPRVEVAPGITVHRLTLTAQGANWTPATARFASLAGRKAAELYRRGAVDVVEFPECEAPGSAGTAIFAAQTAQPRPATIVHLHTPTEVLLALRSIGGLGSPASLALYVLLERASLVHADALCAPSEFIADWARREYGLPERPCVIPYAIGRPPKRQEGPRARRVLYVGRIEPRKGVEPLIRAWRAASGRMPGWTLRLIGADTTTGPDTTSMWASMQALLPPDVRPTVEYVGARQGEALASEYASASFCVVPSLWENFPNTCIEAMLHGTPVIASEDGGMAEMLEGVSAGCLVPAGDDAALADAMARLASEPPASLENLGERCRRRIVEYCDPIRVASLRLDFYKRAITTARRGSTDCSSLRMETWRQIENVARGRASLVTLPAFKPSVARWVQAEATP